MLYVPSIPFKAYVVPEIILNLTDMSLNKNNVKEYVQIGSSETFHIIFTEVQIRWLTVTLAKEI